MLDSQSSQTRQSEVERENIAQKIREEQEKEDEEVRAMVDKAKNYANTFSIEEIINGSKKEEEKEKDE